MNRFNDKIILITGAGRGFGRAAAQALAAQGGVVAAVDITPIHVDQMVAEIIERGGRAKAYVADLSKKMPVQALLNEVLDDWGRIDILINYPSVKPRAAILEMDEWDWHRTLDSNLTGAFLLAQSVGRVMRAQGGGVILNLIDMAPEAPEFSAYASSMRALDSLTRSASAEFEAYNIFVSAAHLDQDKDQEEILEEILEACGPPASL